MSVAEGFVHIEKYVLFCGCFASNFILNNFFLFLNAVLDGHYFHS